MAIIKYKNAEGEWEDLIYAQTQGGGGVAPARYITEIKTEPLMNINGGTGGTWTEFFYNDGTVEAEAIVHNMTFSVAETYTDYGMILSNGFGVNCFENPTNFTLEAAYVDVYKSANPIVFPRVQSNNCQFYAMGVVFRMGATLPTSVTCSYIIKAKGTA